MSSFSSFLLRFPLYDFIIKYVMSVVIIVCRSVTDGSENKRPEQKPNKSRTEMRKKTDYLNAFDSNSFANTRAKKKDMERSLHFWVVCAYVGHGKWR